MELEVLALIQISSSISSVHAVKTSMFLSLFILSSKMPVPSGIGFLVQFFLSSSSVSSSIQSSACLASFFANSRGLHVWHLLILMNCRGFFVSCQVKSPVLQLISGLYSCSQGKLRMIFCFPSPVTSKQRFVCFLLISAFNSTKEVIVPFLFLVLSTFRAHRGLSSFLISNPAFFA